MVAQRHPTIYIPRPISSHDVPYKSTPNRVSWHPTHTSLTGKPLFRTRTSTYPPRTLTSGDSSAQQSSLSRISPPNKGVPYSTSIDTYFKFYRRDAGVFHMPDCSHILSKPLKNQQPYSTAEWEEWAPRRQGVAGQPIRARRLRARKKRPKYEPS